MRPKTILPILMILLFLPKCSVIHGIFRKTEAVAPHQGQVVRKPIPKQPLNTGGPPVKIVKRGHSYVYESVRSARAQQFIITEMPVLINPPERALKVRLNLEKAPIARRVETKKSPAAKPIEPEAAKTPQSRRVKPDRYITPDRPIQTLTVSFPINSCALTPHETGKLNQFIRSHKPGQSQAMDVTGYTCWLGSKKYNQSLALKRAKAVASRLEKAGVSIRSVTGKGKCCYIDRKNPAPNRRAEVTVFRSGFRRGESGKGGDAAVAGKGRVGVSTLKLNPEARLSRQPATRPAGKKEGGQVNQ